MEDAKARGLKSWVEENGLHPDTRRMLDRKRVEGLDFVLKQPVLDEKEVHHRFSCLTCGKTTNACTCSSDEWMMYPGALVHLAMAARSRAPLNLMLTQSGDLIIVLLSTSSRSAGSTQQNEPETMRCWCTAQRCWNLCLSLGNLHWGIRRHKAAVRKAR